MKQVNIGVGHRLAVFVNNGARQMALGLVDALHGNYTIGLGDAHRIEAYYLTNGIRQGAAMKHGSDTEILKFVVDETHFVTA